MSFFTFASMEIIDTRPASAVIASFITWAIAAFLLFGTLPPKPAVSLDRPASKALLAFIITLFFANALALATGIRTDSQKLIPQTASLLFMTLPFFVLQAVAIRADATRVVLLTAHVVLGISAVSVLGDFLGFTSYEIILGRYFGFLGDGVAWALTFPLLVFFCSKRLLRAGASLLCLGLTGSRAPALCVAAALMLLIAFSHGRRLQYVVILGLMAVVAAYQSEVFLTLFDRLAGTQFTSNDRLTTAALGLRVFEYSPLFGSGYNAQAYYFPETERRSALGLYHVQTSTIVQMLGEGGLLLFLAYVAFVIAVTLGGILVVRRMSSDPRGGAVVGATVWLLSMLWVNQSAAWFLVGSYLGPLILATAGIVSGYSARLRFIRRQELTSPAVRR